MSQCCSQLFRSGVTCRSWKVIKKNKCPLAINKNAIFLLLCVFPYLNEGNWSHGHLPYLGNLNSLKDFFWSLTACPGFLMCWGKQPIVP